MAIYYKLQPVSSRNLVGETDVITYMVRHVPVGTLSLEQLAQRIADKTSQSEADVYGLVLALAREILNGMVEGYVIDAGPLGRMAPLIRAREPIRDRDGFSASRLRVTGIALTPESSLMRRLSGVVFRHDGESEVLETAGAKQREQAILAETARAGYMSASACRLLNNVSASTARRDLDRLVGRGLLKRLTTGRYPIYVAA